jgi:hypothetical protein
VVGGETSLLMKEVSWWYHFSVSLLPKIASVTLSPLPCAGLDLLTGGLLFSVPFLSFFSHLDYLVNAKWAWIICQKQLNVILNWK